MGSDLRTLGLIGGINWQGTREYYRLINEGVNRELGGHHSAKLIMHSVDFGEIIRYIQKNNWDAIAQQLVDAARGLERAGAEGLMICNGMMHKVADIVASAINIPLVHGVDCVGEAMQHHDHRRIGLLSNEITMMGEFYYSHLEQKFGLEIIIPDKSQRLEIDRIISDVLCHGNYPNQERETFLSIINSLRSRGAESVVIACTEIARLVQQPMTPVPLYESAPIHCAAAVNFLLNRTAKRAAA